MKLYFECNMGAAGDMIASALVDLFDDGQKIVDELNGLSLPETEIVYGRKEQSGILATHLDIVIKGERETHDDTHSHHSAHRGLHGIYHIIETLGVSEKVKSDIKNIYMIIAEAEAEVHGKEVGEIHFHELGTLDAVADISICAYLIDKLKPEKIICSPINVGNGTVKCAHGVLPVPAPATAIILNGMPFYKSDIQTELCTPTGAAIIKYFANEYTPCSSFDSVKKIGTGCGTKELSQANIIRIYEAEESSVTELSCNIDDMTGEEAAFATEIMMKNGANDCFITPVLMKKGRPAYLFTVICQNEKADEFAKLIFKHTPTIGIRKYTPSRYKMDRTVSEENGVHIKRSEGYGTVKEKAEFEDIKKLALEKDISVFQAREILNKK